MSWPLGVIMLRRLVIRSRPPGAGTPDHPRAPPLTSGPVLNATASRGHSRSRAGERCIGPRPCGPFDATTKPERGAGTDATAPPDDGPPPDAEALRTSVLRAERHAWKRSGGARHDAPQRSDRTTCGVGGLHPGRTMGRPPRDARGGSDLTPPRASRSRHRGPIAQARVDPHQRGVCGDVVPDDVHRTEP
jgi:hypothetical protein